LAGNTAFNLRQSFGVLNPKCKGPEKLSVGLYTLNPVDP
jgi:hypothetical protein